MKSVNKKKPTKTRTKPIESADATMEARTIDISETPKKQVMDISNLPEKQQAYALLRENGLNTAQAAKALGYCESSAYQLNHKLKKYSLTNPKMVSSASKVVKNILEGKTFGAVDKIKDSTALQAAQMVYDRIEPTKQANTGDTNITFMQINLGESNGQ